MTAKCTRCGKEFNSYDSLRRHVGRIHKINTHEFYVEYYLNGVWPTCACGCGEKVKHPDRDKYKQGHVSRIKNNWGHNPEAVRKSHATQKEMYESGELEVWNKGLTKENDSRVAEYADKLKGREITWKDKLCEYANNRTEEHKKNLTAAIRKTVKENREKWNKLGHRVQRYKAKYRFNKQEMRFYEEVLVPIFGEENIKQQQWIKGYSVDFLINNNLIIEYFGDYWHCNPDKYNSEYFVPQMKKKASEIWKKDQTRLNELKKDHDVVIVWENDFKHSKLKVCKELTQRR